MSTERRYLILIYAHANRQYVRRSTLLDYLRGVAGEVGLEFWWDEQLAHPLWDEEIRDKLEAAAVVVLFVSQAFLISSYITEVEAKRTFERLIDDDLCVIAVMYQRCLWESHAWLPRVHHLPQGGYVHRHPNRAEVFYEVAQFIKRCLGRPKTFKSPKVLSTLRRVPDTRISKADLKQLKQDAVAKADRFVPNRGLQQRISDAARSVLAEGAAEHLSKSQLEKLDRRFLAGKEGRKPDAKKVRWVLRAHGLHPQGKAWD